MFFDVNLKPELCTSDDERRQNLMTVELVREREKGFLVATDGLSLCKVAVSGADGDALGPIQSEALEHARKIARKAKSGFAEIRCGLDTLTFADGSAMSRCKRPEGQSFPDYGRVIPTPPDFRILDKVLFEASKENPGPYVLKLGLNPELLMQAVKALGLKGIVALEVRIVPPTVEGMDTCRVLEPITIRAHDGTLAAVMPGWV